MPRKFTTEEKSQILARVAEIGATAAAKEAGVHYNSILKWMKESKDTVKAGAEKIATMPGGSTGEDRSRDCCEGRRNQGTRSRSEG